MRVIKGSFHFRPELCYNLIGTRNSFVSMFRRSTLTRVWNRRLRFLRPDRGAIRHAIPQALFFLHSSFEFFF